MSPKNSSLGDWEKYYIKKVGHKKDASQTFQAPIIETLSELIDIRDKLILEVGCGRAGDCRRLAELGSLVVGLDHSETALQAVGQSIGNSTILLVLADAFHLPFADESFDVVFHQGFLEHFHDPELLLSEQYRVLKKDGILLVDVPQRLHVYTVLKHLLMLINRWPAGWETEFSISELRSLIEKHKFHVIREYGWGSLIMWVLEHYKIVRLEIIAQKWKWLCRLQRKWWNSKLACGIGLNIGVVAIKSGKEVKL